VSSGRASPQTPSRGALISIGLVVAALAVYGQTAGRDFEFIRIDDPDYVSANPHVTSGLSPENLSWAVTSFDANNWHPLTWLSLQFDAQLFGLDPRAFHVVNMLLHAVNSVLLFLLLRRMTGAEWPSAFVAALFALHPAHVESVAWISERKDVLSGLFWMLTTIAYVRYAESPGAGRYVLVLILFALGLMAKPMLVTLPATLLLLDYWPLRRSGLGRLVLEKLPLFALVAATIPLTMMAQTKMAKSLQMFPLYVRVENALVAYAQYIVMLFWPVDLAIFYPHPGDAIPLWQPVAAGVLLLAVSVVAIWQRRRRPYLLVGWLWFLGTLVPVIGLMQVGMQARADRYTYIPYIGLFIIIVWIATELASDRTRWIAAAAALTLIAYGVLSFIQIRYWRDTETLWRHDLAVTPDNGVAHEGLGLELLQAGKFEEARDHLRESIRLGRHSTRTHGNLAVALQKLGDLDGAAAQYHLALLIDPDSVPAHLGLAEVREAQHRYEDARDQLRAALAIEPNSYTIHRDLALVLNRLGQTREALEECEAALRLESNLAEANNNKGLVLESAGRFKDAAASYQRAATLEPRHLIIRLNLAYALHESGQTADAAKEYAAASRIRPNWPQAAMAEAWQKATSADAAERDGKQSLRLAKQVVQAIGSRTPQALDVLAASYAELGRFEDAVATQRRLVDSIPLGTSAEMLKELRERLALYEKHQPYRHP
jgi:Tfp pilus assembly protein PilF